MPHPPVTDVAKFELIQTLDAIPVVNVFHLHLLGGWNATQLTAACTSLAAHFGTQEYPNLSVMLQSSEIIGTDLGVSTGGAQVTQAFVLAGGDTGDSAPAQVSLVMSWRTGLSGRSFRGRTYWAGIPAHVIVDPRHVSSSFQNAMQTAANQYLTAMAAAGYDPVVVSYFNAGAARVTPLATTITTAIVNDKLDTQRRRSKQ